MFLLFDRSVGTHEALSQQFLQRFALGQVAQRFLQVPGQPVGHIVAAALQRLARLEIAQHTEVAARQRCGDRQVGIGIGAGDAVLEPHRGGCAHRHAQAHGAVVVAPVRVDGRRLVAGDAPVGVDVGREKRHGRRQIGLQAADKAQEQRRIVVGRRRKQISPLSVGDALMDVHGAARLALHRLGHEGGVDVVAQRRFAHGALEQEHLVGQAQRIAVHEVDLHLRGARFVHQRIDFDLLHLAVVVDVVQHRVELVDRVDAE